MNKSTLALLVAATLAVHAAPAQAESLTYTGNGQGLTDTPPLGYTGGSDYLYPASSSGNTVTVNYDPAAAGVVNPSYVLGGVSNANTSGDVTASDNTVTINDGTVSGDVTGGYAQSYGYMNNTSTGVVTANNNTVTINGGTVNGNVTGGFVEYIDGPGNLSATHNTVTIGADATLAPTTELLGGNGSFVFVGSNADLFTGNTLNIAGQHSIGGIINFKRLNFTLPNTLANGDTLITADWLDLNGLNTPSAETGSTASTVNSIHIAGGGSALAPGSTVTLIEAGAWNWNNTISNTTTTGMKGMSLIYDWENIHMDGTSLVASVRAVSVNPQTHALLSGRSAQTALLGQGADLVAGRGMKSLKQSAKQGFGSFVGAEG